MGAKLMDASRSLLVLVDYQARLMPAIADGDRIVAAGRRLVQAARLFGVGMIVTEQYAKGLGATVEALGAAGVPVVAKNTFGACATPAFVGAIGEDKDLIVAGCEAQVCLLQTVLGLRERGRRVFVVRDATGSRHMEDKEAALARMAQHGAEIVTSEMVVFEWARTSEHPKFRQAIAIVK